MVVSHRIDLIFGTRSERGQGTGGGKNADVVTCDVVSCRCDVVLVIIRNGSEAIVHGVVANSMG